MSDVASLFETPLGEHALAYVPFCKVGREEMRDYMYWNTPQWLRYYQNRTYHFGAIGLYDLKRYQSRGLSSKMAEMYNTVPWRRLRIFVNVDQDLVHQLSLHEPILDLPQEWLWCSWCESG